MHNVIDMPHKKIIQKYNKISFEVELDPTNDTWRWSIVHRVPTLFEGNASTCNKAIAMAKRKIDRINGDV